MKEECPCVVSFDSSFVVPQHAPLLSSDLQKPLWMTAKRSLVESQGTLLSLLLVDRCSVMSQVLRWASTSHEEPVALCHGKTNRVRGVAT